MHKWVDGRNGWTEGISNIEQGMQNLEMVCSAPPTKE